MKKIIYQVLPRLWGNGRMSEWDEKSFSYLKSLNVDYIWFTGIPRHASGKPFVKGDPGCPYSISDWMDVNPYLADNPENRMQEFCSLVERVHAAGLKCLIDFIPNHVACDYSGDIVHHDWCDGDWTDTLKNDYDDPRTCPACLDVLRFWASKGVDGFRCDMVELVPAEAMKYLIDGARKAYPELLFVAEVYGKENYGKYIGYVGFDLLYDKSGAYDILRSIITGGGCARALTWNWQWLSDMQPAMLNFLENHDEQRLASGWFASFPEKAYAALAYSALFNTASFMLYFGQEVGEDAAEGHEGRTSIFNWCNPVPVRHLNSYISTGKGLSRRERSILSGYRTVLGLASRPVFREGNTWDLCYCQDGNFDADRHTAFLRYNGREAWLVFCNFSGTAARTAVKIPPEPLGKELRVDIEAAPWDYAAVRI